MLMMIMIFFTLPKIQDFNLDFFVFYTNYMFRECTVNSKVCPVGVSYGTCPLLLDGRHLLFSEAPVFSESFPVSRFQELVRQAPAHGAELLGLKAVVEFKP